MVSVRLHFKAGTVWALCKCSACGDVHKYSIKAAIAGPIACKKCAHRMDIKGAVVEAVDRMPGAATSGSGPGNGSTHGAAQPSSSRSGSGKRDPEGGQNAFRRNAAIGLAPTQVLAQVSRRKMRRSQDRDDRCARPPIP